MVTSAEADESLSARGSRLEHRSHPRTSAAPMEMPPPGGGTSRATCRGVYNALGERKHCSTADCLVADEIAAVLPGGRAGTRALAAMQTSFTRRAGRLMITAKVDQFLVCGVDLGLGEPLHRFLRRCAGPDEDPPTVIYLDDVPEAVAQARTDFGVSDTHAHAALVDHRAPRAAIQASLSPSTYRAIPESGDRPEQAYRTVDDLLESDRPIGLIHCGLLPHLAGGSDPGAALAIMRDWDSVLPDGSFVALSHFCLPGQDSPLAAVAAKIESVFSESALGAAAFLTPEQIATLFGGHILVPPAPGLGHEVVPVERFWPDGPFQDQHSAALAPLLWGGVARKGRPFGLAR